MRLILLMFFVFACSKDMRTPEGALYSYVTDVSQGEPNRDFYMERTTGDLKSFIKGMTDEQFANFNQLPAMSQLKVDIEKKICEGDRCSITYIVKYNQLSGGKLTDKIESKKLAVLLKIEDLWKISNIKDIKTSIEASKQVKSDS